MKTAPPGNHRPPGPEIRVLAAILLFPAAVQVLTLAVSLARWEISRAGAAGIIAAGLLAALGYYRLLRGPATHRGAGRSRPAARFSGAIRLTVLFAGIFYLLLWALAYAFPDLGFDGLWYHTPTMHFWNVRGYVHWIPCDVPLWTERINHSFNGWPKGVELLGFIGMRAAGIPRLLNALNLPFLALGVFSIYCLARIWSAPPDLSLLAGSLFIFIPSNIGLSFTTLIDPAAAAFYIALLALIAVVVRMIGEGTVPWKILPGLGAALGLALGAKGPAIILPPLAAGLLLGVFLLTGRRPGRRRWVKAGVIFILGVCLFGVAVGGYWSLRNLALTGSPVYPVGLEIGGRTIFPGAGMERVLRKPFLPGTEEWPQWRRVFLSWLDNFGQWRVAITRNDHPSGGMGLLWILGGLPALIILMAGTAKRLIFVRRGKRRLVAELPFLVIMVMVLVLFSFLPPGHNHKTRYVLWLYGPGLAAWAVVLGRARTAGSGVVRRLGGIWTVIAVAVITFQGLYCLRYHYLRLCGQQRPGYGNMRCPARVLGAFAADYPSGYFWGDLSGSVFDFFFNDHRPVALGPLPVMAQPILGHLVQNDNFGRRAVYFLDPELAEDPEKIGEFIRGREIRYVIWDQGMPLPLHLRRMAMLDEAAGSYFRVLVFNLGLVRCRETEDGS